MTQDVHVVNQRDTLLLSHVPNDLLSNLAGKADSLPYFPEEGLLTRDFRNPPVRGCNHYERV